MAKLVKWRNWGKINQFEKGESGNPNGQPRKLFSTINKELKAKGIKPLSKAQLIEAYELIFNTDEEELKKLATDKSVPFMLRLIIMELSDKKARAKAMADYRDYCFWRAKQEIDNNHKVTEYKFTSNLESE